MHRLVSALVVILLLPSPAHAWGRVGHRVVCEIAYARLSEDAKREVDRLIALDTEFERFPESCSWVDSPRKRSEEHFVNVPRGARDVAPATGKNVVSAILEDARGLGDRTAPDPDRLEHLKFLAHWVGDVHQPLHVSFADDRGGNDIRVRGECSGTLHGAWDGCILEKSLGTDAQAIAAQLAELRLAGASDAPREWANESLALVRDPRVGYCMQRDERCDYALARELYDKGSPKRTVIVDEAYVAFASEVIRRRLAAAGVRLAVLLERALGPENAGTAPKE